MNQHPPERITPLPWSFELESNGSFRAYRDGMKLFSVIPQNVSPVAGMENSKHVIKALNNYPKLEALNSDCLKEIQALVEFIEYLRKNEGVTLGADFVESGKTLIAKAKGGSNG